MSWQASNWVTEHSQHKGSELLCLLMISNHAHADGTNAFPSIEVLARECRMSERQITRIITNLEKGGELLVERGVGRGNKHNFTVVMGAKSREKDTAKDAVKGDKLSESQAEKVTSCPIKGDILTQEKVTYSHLKGDILTEDIYKVPVSEPMNRHKEKENINTLSLTPSQSEESPLPFDNGGSERDLPSPLLLEVEAKTHPTKAEPLEVTLLRAFRRSRFPKEPEKPTLLQMKQFGPIMKAAAKSHVTAAQIEAATTAALERYSEARMVTPHSVLRNLDALLEAPPNAAPQSAGGRASPHPRQPNPNRVTTEEGMANAMRDLQDIQQNGLY